MGVIEVLVDRAKKQALEQGRHEEALEIAREMKKEGIPVEQIIKFTKLSIKEVQMLEQEVL